RLSPLQNQQRLLGGPRLQDQRPNREGGRILGGEEGGRPRQGGGPLKWRASPPPPPGGRFGGGGWASVPRGRSAHPCGSGSSLRGNLISTGRWAVRLSC